MASIKRRSTDFPFPAGQSIDLRYNRWAGIVTHQECLLLNRVLLDKTKLPVSCRASPTIEDVPVSTAKTEATPGDDGTIGGLVRRLTGAASEVLSLAPMKRGGDTFMC